MGIEDLDSIELGLLGHTVGGAANRARDVGAVTVSVGGAAVTGVVGKVGGAAAKLGVSGVDAGVNDIGACAGSVRVIASVGCLARCLAGETSDTPRGAALGDVGIDVEDGILLDVFDLWIFQRLLLPCLILSVV